MMLKANSLKAQAKAGRHAAGCPCCSAKRNFFAAPVSRRAQAASTIVRAEGNGASVATVAKPEVAAAPAAPKKNLAQRHTDVLKYFPSALGVDDFIGRVEVSA